MAAYILRRLLLMVPTLLGILALNFIIVQAAPGGPVERALAEIQGLSLDSTARISGSSGEVSSSGSDYRGSQGLDPQLIARIEQQYGFDKPAHERFWLMLKSYLMFDFGSSFYSDKTVLQLIAEKLPVSISLGLWTTLITYLVSVPLGIRKAMRHGTPFDVWSSSVIIIGYAIPNFLFAILLIVLFAGGTYWNLFPLRGLTSPGFEQLSWYEQIIDYLWHITLPVLASVVSSFATLTMLTKNSFLDEIHKQYVLTARAKGLSDNAVLYRHVFRNAMLIIIAGMPAALVGIFFTGSMLIEVIFSLDGLGLLGFEAVMNRDYPVMFGTLYIFTLIGLLLKLISDVTYVLVDPRIDFESRET
ncbi:microcin C ABC transporter permease YejB [Balneatrix alpica]|uniref:Microcin C ABC transporter permease YejB n=1 Tax=Balneatrix alpica TaxID=75684 RepID=A0ABV5ZB73_9GAMM|nr:microcin C ABC transporter permease YejB [Balneatrix alpica]